MARVYTLTCDKCGTADGVQAAPVAGQRADLCSADLARVYVAIGFDKTHAAELAAAYTPATRRNRKETDNAEPVQ